MKQRLPGQGRHRHGRDHPGRRRAPPGAAHRARRPARATAAPSPRCPGPSRNALRVPEALRHLVAATCVKEGLAMRKRQDLTWSQVVMAANTPMLLKAAMVDGRPDLGVMSSGQVVGVIDDLPTVAELIDRIMAEADAVLHEADLGLTAGRSSSFGRRWRNAARRPGMALTVAWCSSTRSRRGSA